MATIAPNKERYAEGAVNLTDEKRQQWAEERSAYIKYHIAYAKTHNIPIINIYEDSLDKNGTGNIDFVSSRDDFCLYRVRRYNLTLDYTKIFPDYEEAQLLTQQLKELKDCLQLNQFAYLR